mmetsp:Transcript_41068/g.76388  ORF Transcript_41068/g.76388 Transcript_41068/m.76388 type:complete len:242 (+) Transcript_41068:106-831(+)
MTTSAAMPEVATKGSTWAFSAQFFMISGPPAAGKTTFLERCAGKFQEQGLSVAGILVPCLEGRRRLQLIGAKEHLPFQINDCVPHDGSGECQDSEATEGVQVGRFVFDKGAFAMARAELDRLKDLPGGPAWILIDEIGPLEVKRQGGLEPAVGDLLRAAARGELGPPQPRFLIVVRPSLRDTVVKTYGLDGTGLEAELSEGWCPGFNGPEARAAAVVNLDVQEMPDVEEVVARLTTLPPLL